MKYRKLKSEKLRATDERRHKVYGGGWERLHGKIRFIGNHADEYFFWEFRRPITGPSPIKKTIRRII